MWEDNLVSLAGQVTIGDLTVNRIGLGTNRISDTPQARELLMRAVELGINFIDTAHLYRAGSSESTIGETLAPYAEGLVVATKGGYNYHGEIASASLLKGELEESLIRLKTDRIDLYQLHRVNPQEPIEKTMRVLKDFQEVGKIRHIGLSEVSVEQLKRARNIVNIVSVQNEYNLLERKHEDVIDYCTQHNIAFIPWYPLGGSHGGGGHMEDKLSKLVYKYQATPQQLAIAWLLKRSPTMLPIPGTLSNEHLEQNLRSATIELRGEDFQQLMNTSF